MSAFWNWYIVILVTANLVGLVWLLIGSLRGQRGVPAQSTTGHVWDQNLEELNNPMPMWWLGMFVILMIFGVVYLALYPGFGANRGLLDWTSGKEAMADFAENNRKQEAVFAKFRNDSIPQLEKNQEALTLGHNVFVNNCAPCHGSDARGAKGFPNLTDSDWLYGGSPDTVVTTIAKGRNGVMPAWGPVLGDKGVEEVANYVLTLSGQKADAALAEAGKARFATICVACHGPDGKGNQAIGAPNLTDTIWLYGGSLKDIETSIKDGRQGHMPTWESTLGMDRIRLVAAWVLSQGPHVETPAVEPPTAPVPVDQPVAAPAPAASTEPAAAPASQPESAGGK